jgi:glucokinase
MDRPVEHILVADVGGTNTGLAVFAHYGEGSFKPIVYEVYGSRRVRSMAALIRRFLRTSAAGLTPGVTRACIDFAGPVEPCRSAAVITNLDWGFTAEQVLDQTPLKEVTLLNDFEAVAYGLEILVANRPESFVRLSRVGKLPGLKSRRQTAVVIGAGTGLGTAILTYDWNSGHYRPIPGEGGHADFGAGDAEELAIAGWIRNRANKSPRNPVDLEKIVSGRGIAYMFEALAELQPGLGGTALVRRIMAEDPQSRPPIIAEHANSDRLCRRVLDIWLRCYARAAKNSALFPLCPDGLFLAGGIAGKMLAELRSGLFMREFTRCDEPNIRTVLTRTPVFVITDYLIGLYGCANVAVNFADDLRPRIAGALDKKYA